MPYIKCNYYNHINMFYNICVHYSTFVFIINRVHMTSYVSRDVSSRGPSLAIRLVSWAKCLVTPLLTLYILGRDGSKSFFASPSQVTSHFLASPSQVTSHFLASPSQVTSHFRASPSQVTSHLVRRQVKSSHKSFGPNTSQVTSLFVQVQVKSHIISSTPVIRRGI